MEYKEITAAILASAIIKQSNKQSDKLINYACDTYNEILSKLENPTCEKPDLVESSISKEKSIEKPIKKRKK